jgi:hypothetical protein
MLNVKINVRAVPEADIDGSNVLATAGLLHSFARGSLAAVGSMTEFYELCF